MFKGHDFLQAFALSASYNALSSVLSSKAKTLPSIAYRNLWHRHRRDVYNTFFPATFTFNRQILDLRSRKQPQYCVLTTYRAKISSLIKFVFIAFSFFLQLFSPRFPNSSVIKIKKPVPQSHKTIYGTGSRARAHIKIFSTFFSPRQYKRGHVQVGLYFT